MNTCNFDDFVVDASGWTITSIFVDGIYQALGTADSVNVIFYSDNGDVPGGAVATLLSQPIVDVAGDFTINLTAPVELSAGTYWVSVQANMDFADEQWFWTDRTVQSGDPAAWINPGGGFGFAACTATWGSRGADCGIDPNNPDQVFSLSGTVGISQIPEPATLALLGLGLAGLAFRRRKRS